ncbi:dihydroneopterin aldolase [Kaistia dalseonensis]|uniref:7,8-dihydroneopterin aldolase n=1 Tax=Kaistia dalseonensis TaxID=410840 RepID=A0ABU0H124_9HYPH|nr:dihydroneopterin aldolase [Kaistia dalseonensis]MCX5493453.1 dihydroneopterin aldolase [Kaistia dalseonensis]MDQ0436012.1 dihydroneopterin aldolase [Kaistia dalseonensis]
MTDRIIITDLRFFGFHGVLPEETSLGQRFRVDITCSLDLGEAGRTDQVENTVHYGQVIEVVERIVTTHRYKLIETLAETIARSLFEAFARIDSLIVRITKPEAPVQIATGLIAIEIERSRSRG